MAYQFNINREAIGRGENMRKVDVDRVVSFVVKWDPVSPNSEAADWPYVCKQGG